MFNWQWRSIWGKNGLLSSSQYVFTIFPNTNLRNFHQFLSYWPKKALKQMACSWHQKNETMNSLNQSAAKIPETILKPFLMVYYFLFIAICKKHCKGFKRHFKARLILELVNSWFRFFLIIGGYRSRTVQYSHLSNKRWAHVYRFWKIPSSSKQKSPLLVYWFLRFFHPPLLVY